MVTSSSSSPRRALSVLFLALLLSTPLSSLASISLQQVFEAVDSNHDNAISENELESAFERLVVADGNGGGLGGNGSGGAPPLGLDSNPFAYQRKNTNNNSSGGGGSTSGANTDSKFDNPKQTQAFLKALFSSFSAIIATEIGDKTFFIAAVLSMRNDRVAVFGGAILALIVMTILRCVCCLLRWSC